MTFEDNPEMTEPIKTWGDAAERLLQVAELTVKTRDAQYGDCFIHHNLTAQMWSALLGVKVRPEDVSVMFILDKIVRSLAEDKPDHWVDVAGYALVHSQVQKRRDDIKAAFIDYDIVRGE